MLRKLKNSFQNIKRNISCLMAVIVLSIFCQAVDGQSKDYFGKKEFAPVIPPKGEKIRILIVSDATNEIDDIWAIALAILSPERFDIVGFVGSNYDHTNNGIGPKSIEKSVEGIKTILSLAGMTDKYPVYPGAHPMQYEFAPSGSSGVDFIIEKALEGSTEDPLWVVGLGAPTDLASAYLKEPKIKDKVIMFWHARTEETWPYRAHNYNIKGDMHASRMMFHSPLPLVLFDTGTHLSAGTLKESEEHIKPFGELGEFLYNYRLKSKHWSGTSKGFFDLGDIAVLVDPELGKWEETICPTVTQYMDYNFYKTNGKIMRCYNVDRDGVFQLLYSKLENKYGK